MILPLLLTLAAQASPLTSVEANCWNKAVDADGSFLCQYVVIGGRENVSYIYPELRAPDGEGNKTFEQANRACELLGFRYAVRFELEKPSKESKQVTLHADGTGELTLSSAPFVQHLNCVD